MKSSDMVIGETYQTKSGDKVMVLDNRCRYFETSHYDNDTNRTEYTVSEKAPPRPAYSRAAAPSPGILCALYRGGRNNEWRPSAEKPQSIERTWAQHEANQARQMAADLAAKKAREEREQAAPALNAALKALLGDAAPMTIYGYDHHISMSFEAVSRLVAIATGNASAETQDLVAKLAAAETKRAEAENQALTALERARNATLRADACDTAAIERLQNELNAEREARSAADRRADKAEEATRAADRKLANIRAILG